MDPINKLADSMCGLCAKSLTKQLDAMKEGWFLLTDAQQLTAQVYDRDLRTLAQVWIGNTQEAEGAQ